MTRAEKMAAKKLDNEIEALYTKNCSYIQIDIWDISKVYAAARKARAENRDMEQEIINFVNSIRKN